MMAQTILLLNAGLLNAGLLTCCCALKMHNSLPCHKDNFPNTPPH
ncbi:MAG: hypothetical protein AAF915_20950 [Cyanobacteria bacterium P01_D01_bin.50]